MLVLEGHRAGDGKLVLDQPYLRHQQIVPTKVMGKAHIVRGSEHQRSARKRSDPDGSLLRLRLLPCGSHRLLRACPSGPSSMFAHPPPKGKVRI